MTDPYSSSGLTFFNAIVGVWHVLPMYWAVSWKYDWLKGIKPHSHGELGLSSTYQALRKQEVCVFIEKKAEISNIVCLGFDPAHPQTQHL